MRLLRASDYRRMPWRNGGGTTTEIVLEPGRVPDRFLYRVSIADVASDGPFSRFDGYERHILVLDGAGMTLDAGAHGSLALRPLEPAVFSGDWDVTGTLVAGPVRDFNVIVDREQAIATLAVHELSTTETIDVPAGETCILHVKAGDIGRAAEGETLVAGASFAVAPSGSTTVVIARIRPR